MLACVDIVNVVIGLKLFSDLFTCQAYVQRGKNDISEDARRLQRQRTGNQL